MVVAGDGSSEIFVSDVLARLALGADNSVGGCGEMLNKKLGGVGDEECTWIGTLINVAVESDETLDAGEWESS